MSKSTSCDPFNIFYENIRKTSFANSWNGSVSDEDIKTAWMNSNWTPVAKLLMSHISEAADSGKFKVMIEVDSKSLYWNSPFEEFRNSPDLAMRGFISLISTPKFEYTVPYNGFGPFSGDPFKEHKTLRWSKKGLLKNFKIRGEQCGEYIHFDISWD